jgi:hypothetical protein
MCLDACWLFSVFLACPSTPIQVVELVEEVIRKAFGVLFPPAAPSTDQETHSVADVDVDVRN